MNKNYTLLNLTREEYEIALKAINDERAKVVSNMRKDIEKLWKKIESAGFVFKHVDTDERIGWDELYIDYNN